MKHYLKRSHLTRRRKKVGMEIVNNLISYYSKMAKLIIKGPVREANGNSKMPKWVITEAAAIVLSHHYPVLVGQQRFVRPLLRLRRRHPPLHCFRLAHLRRHSQFCQRKVINYLQGQKQQHVKTINFSRSLLCPSSKLNSHRIHVLPQLCDPSHSRTTAISSFQEAAHFSRQFPPNHPFTIRQPRKDAKIHS